MTGFDNAMKPRRPAAAIAALLAGVMAVGAVGSDTLPPAAQDSIRVERSRHRGSYLEATGKLGEYEQGKALAALVRSERRRN